MSKNETWRTRNYWGSVGGLLIEEYLAVSRDNENRIARRLIDGIIVLGETERIQTGGTFDLLGRDIIIVQTKSSRLGMSLMGQAFFSREIIKAFKPKSMRVVAICGHGDSAMEKLCLAHGIDVVVIGDDEALGAQLEI